MEEVLQIRTIEDFERILIERPEWKERIRRLTLTEELLNLPAEFNRFAKEDFKPLKEKVENIEKDAEVLKKDVEVLKQDVAVLKDAERALRRAEIISKACEIECIPVAIGKKVTKGARDFSEKFPVLVI